MTFKVDVVALHNVRVVDVRTKAERYPGRNWNYDNLVMAMVFILLMLMLMLMLMLLLMLMLIAECDEGGSIELRSARHQNFSTLSK